MKNLPILWRPSANTTETPSNLDPSVKLSLILLVVAIVVISCLVEFLRRRASNDTSPDFFGAASAKKTLIF